jgi:ABC-type phosphate transport system substrate-binding protein
VGNSFDNKTFTKKEIHSIFKGNKNYWDNGNSVSIVLVLNDEDEKSKYVAEQIYNKSVLSVKKYWLGLVFQGRFEAPVFVSNNEEVLEVLKKNTGAIGILVDYKEELDSKSLLNILD